VALPLLAPNLLDGFARAQPRATAARVRAPAPQGRPARYAPGYAVEQRCDRFVHIRGGVFHLDNAPWTWKSVNFRMGITGKEVDPRAPQEAGTPRVVVAGKSLDLFLTAEGNYSPDNNSYCRDPAPPGGLVCCTDRASCAADLAAEATRLQALGVSSVRLLMDTFKFVGGVPTFTIGRMPWLWNMDFGLDMRDGAHRDAVVLLVRRAVQFLGARGIRSLLLLNGHPVFKDRAGDNAAYTSFTAALAAGMRDEPYLVGFDFVNEPTWIRMPAGVTNFSIDKRGARDLVRTWVHAVRVQGANPHALLTIGNAHATASVDTWDPAFLPLDFNSYHIYPPVPTWPAAQSIIAKETFYSAVGGCGASKACGEGRMPYIIGEFGNSVHEVDVRTGAVTKPTHGDAEMQARYLKGVADYAHACGYQGVQWWQFADVHWGDAVQDHYGLWGDFRQVYPGKALPAPDAMAMRPAGATLRDHVNLLGPRPACNKPADFETPAFGTNVPKQRRFRYRGSVVDQKGRRVPFALLRARLSGGGDVYFDVFAGADGRYDFKTPRLLEKIRATHFGHHTSRWHVPVPVAPQRIKVQRADSSELPAYNPPSQNAQSCREVVF
jgi:hypothetical protein